MRPPRPPKPDAALWWRCNCGQEFAAWSAAERHSRAEHHHRVELVWNHGEAS